MMPRYVTMRPRAVVLSDDPNASVTADQVIVPDDDGPRDTGLLSANGEKLYRILDRGPYGFVAERLNR